MEEWKEYKLEDICSDIFAGGDAKKLKITQEKTVSTESLYMQILLIKMGYMDIVKLLLF